jgi:CBS domain containing-hemolysin-like protein
VAAEGCGPTVGAVERALTETGYSRFPVTDASGTAIGYLHIKDVLPQINDPDAVLDVTMVRPLPRLPASLPLPDALSRMRRSKSHLALVVDECGPDECMPDESVREAHVLDDAAPGDNSDAAPAPNGTVTAMVALEDMVEDLVGTVRDGTHRV